MKYNYFNKVFSFTSKSNSIVAAAAVVCYTQASELEKSF